MSRHNNSFIYVNYGLKTDDPSFGSAGGGLSPFLPSRVLLKRNALPKRARNMIQILEHEAMSEVHAERPISPFAPGDIIEVEIITPENKRKVTKWKASC
jgi:hypothetical protein